jgi:hypothetical protein
MEHGILGVYRAGSQKAVPSELAKHNLDIMGSTKSQMA